MEMLNIDPECKILQKKFLSNKVLLCDTNFLISLLLKNHENHEISIQILNLTKSLGIKIYYTNITKEEFLNVLEKADIRYNKIKGIKKSLMKDLNNPFIREYAISTESKDETWEGYFLTLRHTFEKKLSNFKIHVFEIDSEMNQLISNEFKSIEDIVGECAMKVGNLKSTSVIEHDAYHITLIHTLREKCGKNILGPDYWFITYDTSLYCVDEQSERKIPASILVKHWLEFITPFLGPDIINETFSNTFVLLIKSRFKEIGTEINVDDLYEILGDWISYDEITTVELREILGDKVIRDLLSQIKECKDEEKRNELRRKVKEEATRKARHLITMKKLYNGFKIGLRIFSGVSGAIFLCGYFNLCPVPKIPLIFIILLIFIGLGEEKYITEPLSKKFRH